MHKLLENKFVADPDTQFIYIQTVWEGFSSNTYEAGLADLDDYELSGWYGFDPGTSGQSPATMTMFDTGGTPYTIIIDKSGEVVESDFTKSQTALRPIIEAALAAP